MQMLQMLERFYRQQTTAANQTETPDTDNQPLLLESERDEPEQAAKDEDLPNDLANLLRQYLPPTE